MVIFSNHTISTCPVFRIRIGSGFNQVSGSGFRIRIEEGKNAETLYLTHHFIILTNFASNINILYSVSGDKNWEKRRKNEGEYTLAANQGALLLLLRRALTHPPLHASLRQTARYQQCYGSGLFIPDPDFYPFRIQQQHQKRRGKKICLFIFCLPVVARNEQKI